ncbi:MAG: EamA family transporter [Clostridia bacterium]|nr:EamA family transporter [Clostridia bacterium]
MKNKTLLGVLAVILSSVCYGITPVLTNGALDGGLPVEFLIRVFGQDYPAALAASAETALPNESVVAFAMGFGCLISLLSLAAKRKLNTLRVDRGVFFSASALGGAAFFATCLLLTYAYRYMDKGATIVLHFTYPAISCIAAALIFKERLTWLKGVAAALAIAGVYFVSNFGGATNALGPIFALLSAVTYATYILGGRYSAYASVDSSVSTVYVTGTASLLGFAAAAVLGTLELPASATVWALLALDGLIGYLIALRLMLYGIRTLGSGTASMLNTLEPVMASVSGIIVFGEAFGLQKGVGYALVLGAALLTVSGSVREDRRQRRAESELAQSR